MSASYDSQNRKDSVLPHQDRLNIAVFIDFDNIEIGVKTTLGQQFDVGIILDAIKERGEVVTKIAYADWTRSGEYSRSLTQHAIRLVQRNMTPGGDKNGADINLALDALEMAFTHQHINAYVIVGGDSDFLSLVEKLKQYDKKVFVVGGRAFTSMILQRNCHEFIAYENLAGVRKNAAKIGRPMPAAAASSPVAQAVADRAPRAEDPRRPRSVAADRPAQEHAAAARLDLLRAQLRRLVVPRFRREAVAGRHRQPEARRPQRDGGAERRRVGRRQRRGRACGACGGHGGGAGAYGEPRRGPDGGAPARASDRRRPDVQGRRRSGGPLRRRRAPGRRGGEPSDVRQTESAEAGVQRAGQILSAATTARWPMYLREREADPAPGRGRVRRAPLRLRRADGSAQGLPARGASSGSSATAAAACACFQGAALQKTLAMPSAPREIMDVEPMEAQPGGSIDTSEPADPRAVRDGADSDRHDGGAARTRQAAQAARPRPAPGRRDADATAAVGPRRGAEVGQGQAGEEGGGAAPLDAQEGRVGRERRQRKLTTRDVLPRRTPSSLVDLLPLRLGALCGYAL